MPPSSKSNRENAQQRPASIPSAPSNHPPGERERVATLSHPVTRGGCRGAESPTPASSETTSTKGQPASSGTKISARTTPGERERVRTLSHPVTRGDVGERSALRSRRRKPKSSKNSLHHRKPQCPPDQPRESARGCEPSSPPSPSGCRGAERPTPASSETKTFKRTNLHRRKPIPQKNSPRVSSRGPQPSRTSNQNDFRRKSSPSRRGGGGPSGPAAGELAPPSACVKPLPRCAARY